VDAWGCPAIGIPPGERREPDAIGRRRHRGGDPDDGGGTAVVIQMTAAGPRVEGLTVETAARLLTLLR
jgi:hypothetical protein